MVQANSSRVKLQGGRYPGARNTVVGEVASGEKIFVTLIIRPETPIPTKLNPFEHLSREEFLARHSACSTDLDAVVNYVAEHDIESRQDAARRTVILHGSIKMIERAFAIKMARYRGEDGTHRGHEGHASVPTELDGIIVAILGLYTGSNPNESSDSTGAANGQGENLVRRQLATVADIETHYGFPEGDAEGQTIGIIELGGGYRKKDVDQFFSSLGISPDYKNILVGSGPNAGINRQAPEDFLEAFAKWMNGRGRYMQYAKPFFEVTMDLSIVGALAPKSNIQMYFGYDTTIALMEIIQEALFVSEPQPSVLSISWGYEERALLSDESDTITAKQINELFLCAAHMGVTICCSGGDWGASNQAADGFPGKGFDVEFPGSCPYALAVGGTTVVQDGSEVVWNADFPPADSPAVPKHSFKHGATGGGYSQLFERPDWQKNDTQVGDVTNKGRAMPDVAAVADPRCGMDWMMAGEKVPSGGTSAGAPLWAALIARLNQKLGTRIGCINPLLYQLASKDPNLFNDVIEGDNRFFKGDVGYEAGPGWDACSGWGTPKGKVLLAALEGLYKEQEKH